MTPESWVAIITAISAAVVAIITALRGEQTKRIAAEASAMAADASALAEDASTMAADAILPPPGIPGGAIVPGVSLGDMVKYIALGQQFGVLLDALNSLPVGETTETPTIKSTWRSKRFELPTGPLKRTK